LSRWISTWRSRFHLWTSIRKRTRSNNLPVSSVMCRRAQTPVSHARRRE
jgi:hypothetical protein